MALEPPRVRTDETRMAGCIPFFEASLLLAFGYPVTAVRRSSTTAAELLHT